MKIGDLKINTPLFFAPLAGYSDSPTRIICKEYGAQVVFTEFVSSEGLIRNSEKTEEYLIFQEKERPIAIQIFGHRTSAMAEAAAYVEEKFKPDMIDINMGCSVRKVVKKGAGSALLKDLEQAESIAKAMVKAVDTPVTAKIRMGWKRENNIALELSRRLEASGIAAITVHPRAAEDGFNNEPDYQTIKMVKETVAIPVIGNGGIDSVQKAKKLISRSYCDGIMVGRWALGNPWLLSRIRNYLKGAKYSQPIPDLQDKFELCLRHLQMEENFRGSDEANKIMKKFYKWYFKGFPNASDLRHSLVLTDNINKSYEILNQHLQETEKIS
jgi:tRNA-dihydrouridine synthase B